MDDNENSPWQYNPKDDKLPDLPDDNSEDGEADQPGSDRNRSGKSYSWQSVEFIEHHHGGGWYAALGVGIVALAAAVFLITKDYFATAVIVVVGIIVWVFAGHKAGQARYEISDSGLKINDKNYPYSSFKSFSILQEGSYSSVNLMPLKRFVPPVAAYFDPKDEDKVVSAVGDYLPFDESRRMDSFDKLSRRLRL